MADEFGDFDPEDALDHEPADPEQVARKLCELEGTRWRDLTDEQRQSRIAIFVLLLAWLRRQGANF